MNSKVEVIPAGGVSTTMKAIKQQIRRLLRKRGYEIIPFTPRYHPLARRKKFLEAYGIDTVLDVGADTGEWSRSLRAEIGYTGRIVSFEPIAASFARLQDKAQGDPRWKVLNHALGDREGIATINIAGNAHSSSLLNMLPAHVKAAPASKYVGTETVRIKTLDSIFPDICEGGERIYLKMDTQGFEASVIKGAERSLERIDTIQMEMSLMPLYEDQLLFEDMYRLLKEKGFALVSIDPGFTEKDTGQLLQVDGIFHRTCS